MSRYAAQIRAAVVHPTQEAQSMHIGAVYPQIELRGDPSAVRRFGLAVEELGFDHLLAYDHALGAFTPIEPWCVHGVARTT